MCRLTIRKNRNQKCAGARGSISGISIRAELRGTEEDEWRALGVAVSDDNMLSFVLQLEA